MKSHTSSIQKFRSHQCPIHKGERAFSNSNLEANYNVDGCYVDWEDHTALEKPINRVADALANWKITVNNQRIFFYGLQYHLPRTATTYCRMDQLQLPGFRIRQVKPSKYDL